MHSMPEQVRQKVGGIWEADLALTIMLVFLIVMLFVAIPLSGVGIIDGRESLLIAGAFSALGISGVFAVTQTRSARILGLLAMTAPIGLGWYSAVVPGAHTGVARAALSTGALGWLAALTLQHVFRRGQITTARLLGAVAVYLLLAVIFGEAYWLLLQVDPVAFQFSHQPANAGAVRSGLTYFSLTTLTTVGYGDIVPVNAAGRSLATMEGLIGQLYPAVLLGRLVSLQMTSAQQDARTRSDNDS
jgi:hypothetical protein